MPIDKNCLNNRIKNRQTEESYPIEKEIEGNYFCKAVDS